MKSLQLVRDAGSCAADSSNSFAGIPEGEQDIAAGNTSGVASGYGNVACDPDSGILFGLHNVIGSDGVNGTTKYSGIGTGYLDTVTGSSAPDRSLPFPETATVRQEWGYQNA